jgi:hypothetical protein
LPKPEIIIITTIALLLIFWHINNKTNLKTNIQRGTATTETTPIIIKLIPVLTESDSVSIIVTGEALFNFHVVHYLKFA